LTARPGIIVPHALEADLVQALLSTRTVSMGAKKITSSPIAMAQSLPRNPSRHNALGTVLRRRTNGHPPPRPRSQFLWRPVPKVQFQNVFFPMVSTRLTSGVRYMLGFPPLFLFLHFPKSSSEFGLPTNLVRSLVPLLPYLCPGSPPLKWFIRSPFPRKTTQTWNACLSFLTAETH